MNQQEKRDLEKIVLVISNCTKVEQIILFGSRAIGSHRASSDWDLALLGSELSLADVLKIQVELDELWLPCAVDILIFEEIQNQSLKEHISRVGIEVWNRTQTRSAQ